MLLAVWHLCSNVKRPVDHRSRWGGRPIISEGSLLAHVWDIFGGKESVWSLFVRSYFGKSSTPLRSIDVNSDKYHVVNRERRENPILTVYMYKYIYIYVYINKHIWGKHFYAEVPRSPVSWPTKIRFKMLIKNLPTNISVVLPTAQALFQGPGGTKPSHTMLPLPVVGQPGITPVACCKHVMRCQCQCVDKSWN